MQTEEFYHLIENPAKLNEDTLQDLKNITSEFPYFQSAWMLYLKNLKKTGHADFEEVLKKAAVAVPNRKKLYRFLNQENVFSAADYYFEQNGAADSGGGLAENEKSGSLIDKFLSSDPSPIRMEKQQEDETDDEADNEIIAKSVAEPDELVTETLAMIYFEQKKYDKALDAFRKLSLKYPEKSVYFAIRMEEIEKLKNI
ncbi:MAG: tetratricopeptide repeat protein [Tangfeifania sp.]